MGHFFANLFSTEDFVRRWNCGNWTAGLGWLHILSDIGIWGAYTAIPAILIFFVLRRKDVPFPPIFFLFGAFIYSCGATHLIEAAIFWWPAYRLLGLVKLITALVSWATVLVLFRLIPQALRIPGIANMNAELQRANNDLNEFAHIVSHDLRAPLRSIRSLAEWIVEDLPDLPQETRENLELLQSRVKRLDGLVEGILRYSRSGKGGVPNKTVNVQDVVEDVAKALLPDDTCKVQVNTKLPHVYFDEVKLQQIFQNLIGNAFKHASGRTCDIQISCVDQGPAWQFCVKDTGPGIAKEHHERIFKMFQTLKPMNDIEVGGIGLPLVKKIVEQHGGKVWVESEVGQGSSFYFTILKQPMGLASQAVSESVNEV